MDSDIVAQAEAFARKAHAGQVMNSVSRDAFIAHPKRVVALVIEAGGSPIELAAAWLHDVAEDTAVTISDIRKEFGQEIADLVDALTDPLHFNGERTSARKRKQAERIRDKSVSAKRVKIADQTDNVRRMHEDPPIGWSLKERLDYTNGAKSIVDECKGVDSFLEERFRLTCNRTLAELTRVSR